MVRPGPMLRIVLLAGAVLGLAWNCSAENAPDLSPESADVKAQQVVVTVVDENNVPVPGAQLTFQQPGEAAVKQETDYAGRCAWVPRDTDPYAVGITKPGFYEIT